MCNFVHEQVRAVSHYCEVRHKRESVSMNRTELMDYLRECYGSAVAIMTVAEVDTKLNAEDWVVQDVEVKREMWPVGGGKQGLKAMAIVYVQGDDDMIISGMAVAA